jgi:hypothetical protein
MRMVLLDRNNTPVPSPGTGFGQYINIQITYPTIFNDTDSTRSKVKFLAQGSVCPADYYTDGDGKLIYFDQTVSSITED